MAALRTWILLTVLLHLPPDCVGSAGLPSRPSPPECFMPCDEISCSVDIHCTWTGDLDPLVPSKHTLHWEPADSEEGHATDSSWSSNGVIQREHFSNHEGLHVWVEAENRYGSVLSPRNFFNTADIIKPPPPNVTLMQQEPLEIQWSTVCGELQLSAGTCDVRNRIKTNRVWPEHKSDFLHIYTLDNPLPGTVYQFQVRCACSIGIMSDWSAIREIRSAEKAPVGEVNIWADCGTSAVDSDCALTWKILPVSEARGVIVAHQVGLRGGDGASTLVNVSADQLPCSETQCHLRWPLRDGSTVTVSAFNALGATEPSGLTLPTPGHNRNDQVLNLQMTEENLTVSWNLPPRPPHDLKEYVVQWKQVGRPPGLGFDWIKVNNSQKTVSFTGHFSRYTPFRVSLFSVTHDHRARHISSTLGYSLEGTPARVPLFKVFSIGATRVTLFWESVPLALQSGVIRFYQIGTNKHQVYNVSVPPQSVNGTFELTNLGPDQDYEVWIRGVAESGPGANTTARFKTNPVESYAYLMPILIAPLTLVLVVVLLSVCRVENKLCPLCLFEKVPDPRNSQIFRQMKLQIHDPLTWTWIPLVDQDPSISVLEVVKVQPGDVVSKREKPSEADKFTWLLAKDGRPGTEGHDKRSQGAVADERDRSDPPSRREEYSQMLDSDDEGKDGCWSSSEEERSTSGYEKHFMPTALEILEV